MYACMHACVCVSSVWRACVTRVCARSCHTMPHIDTEYDRAKVPPYNGSDPPPAPGSLKALLFPPLLNEVQNKGTQGVRARYGAELPPFIFHCPEPRSSSHIGHGAYPPRSVPPPPPQKSKVPESSLAISAPERRFSLPPPCTDTPGPCANPHPPTRIRTPFSNSNWSPPQRLGLAPTHKQRKKKIHSSQKMLRK